MLGYLAQDRGFQLGSRGSDSQPTFLSLLDMLKAYAEVFYKVAFDLQELRLYAAVGRKRLVSENEKARFEAFLTYLKSECANLELKHTLNMALGIESKYRSKKDGDVFPYEKYIGSDLVNDLDAIDISFCSELHEQWILRIASGKTDYFEKDDLFGPEVSGAFPSARDDIKSAGNCFAVEQWDARRLPSYENP